MDPRTLAAFQDELASIYGMEKEAFPKILEPAKKVVKKALTVQDRIQRAARDASIHLYVKGGKAVRKAVEIGEDMAPFQPANPKGRHMK